MSIMLQDNSIILPKGLVLPISYRKPEFNVMASLSTKWVDEPDEKLVKEYENELDKIHRAWVYMWYGDYINGSIGIPDITNTTRTFTTGGNYNCIGQIAGVTYGPRLGTSSAALDLANYALGAAIAHGSTSGTLYHNAGTQSSPVTVGNYRSFNITRTFNNNSGGDINVEECGLYAYNSAVGDYRFLMCRDLTGTVLVANGKVATLVYTIKVTV